VHCANLCKTCPQPLNKDKDGYRGGAGGFTPHQHLRYFLSIILCIIGAEHVIICYACFIWLTWQLDDSLTDNALAVSVTVVKNQTINLIIIPLHLKKNLKKKNVNLKTTEVKSFSVHRKRAKPHIQQSATSKKIFACGERPMSSIQPPPPAIPVSVTE